MSASDLDAAIRARLDQWDRDHDTTGCPSGPECLHAAVGALRAVLDEVDRCRRAGVAIAPAVVLLLIARELGITEEAGRV